MKRIIDYDKLRKRLENNEYYEFADYELEYIFRILEEVEEWVNLKNMRKMLLRE